MGSLTYFILLHNVRNPQCSHQFSGCLLASESRALTGSCIYQCISVSAHIKIFGESHLRSDPTNVLPLILFVLIIIIQGDVY